ncbi:MAG: 16S rRNA (guanine(966)-N(2))-methyltransferase RsmD [Kiritimatiellae bacterium]|nr:16S rRNA (guanine(966)-N(2))-methyltransferase RsmD [Kiritimatiellia bacterium]
MRIAGGKYRGQSLKAPKSGDIRPTQESVREALFSILMGTVPGSRFLDLFSGSGAVGIEALSRGAAHATLVEANPRHLAVIKANITAILGENAQKAAVVRADAYSWLAGFGGAPYDIVFADPPYALGEERGYEKVLATLAMRGVVKEGGFFVAEMTSRQKAVAPEGWEVFRDRCYGKTRLVVWQRLRALPDAI